ncbi:MAG: methionine--tRNA ligase, partial [Alphaproteobacteria bacterium]|nr:methionine--tRNA ligase [Alphaproteobacteria bacterium]
YAIKDEAYYTEEELINKDGKLVAPTGAEVEWREEESYFFKLSAFTEKLLDYYDNHNDFIAPQSRFNEVYSFVKGGLIDLSISRSSFAWGIPVPGDSTHVIYVWLDALTNYISELGYPNIDEKFKNFWDNSIHMVGKDIIRFHAVYWPAFLMAADLPLPKRIFAHGWWLNEGQKISKSTGNVIDPHDVINKYGLDSVRYFLFREVPFGNDGDFSGEAIKNRINNDLANGYGNLLQRSLSMLHKSFDGKIPVGSLNEEQNLFLDNLLSSLSDLRNHMDKQEFSKYLDVVWESIRYGNAYMAEVAPWNLLKEGKEREAGEALTFILEIVKIVAIYLSPFMPDASINVLQQLNIAWDEKLDSLGDRFKESHQLNTPTPVFTKILD